MTVRPGRVKSSLHILSLQSLSRFWLFATPWTAACQASLSITNSWSPPKPMSIESVMPSSHLILCCPLLLLPSIRVFSNESALLIRWPKYWSISFSIRPSNEHPGLISFSMDWLDLLAVQGTLRSLLQHHSSKASILLHSAFFIVFHVAKWEGHVRHFCCPLKQDACLEEKCTFNCMGCKLNSYFSQNTRFHLQERLTD